MSILLRDKIWCIVSFPDGAVTEFSLPAQARGQHLMEEVGKRIGLNEEIDYFGFRFNGRNRDENLWLNMRNRICRQIAGSQPYRLEFRVKFYVEPHMIVGGPTRHQFYLNIKRDIEQEKLSPTTEQAVRIFALLAQAMDGNFNDDSPHSYNEIFGNFSSLWSEEIKDAVALEHSKLTDMRPESAEYCCLKEVASLQDYGVEFHSAKSTEGQHLLVGVGTEGIAITDKQTELTESISFNCLKMATHTNKGVEINLETFEEEEPIKVMHLLLPSREASVALYRSITEHHSFYLCDTVQQMVRTQFTRDFKETFISLFSENNSEKSYIFDVRRTCREVYDSARRYVFKNNTGGSGNDEGTQDCTVEKMEESDSNSDQKVKHLENELAKMQDAFKCRICMDRFINTVFCPCGHMVCCDECAEVCESCPLCRSAIERTQRIFLPALTS